MADIPMEGASKGGPRYQPSNNADPDLGQSDPPVYISPTLTFNGDIAMEGAPNGVQRYRPTYNAVPDYYPSPPPVYFGPMPVTQYGAAQRPTTPQFYRPQFYGAESPTSYGGETAPLRPSEPYLGDAAAMQESYGPPPDELPYKNQDSAPVQQGVGLYPKTTDAEPHVTQDPVAFDVNMPTF